MVTKEMIDRINQLSHKSKNEGLTADEKEEQLELRAAYVASIRENVLSQLSRIRFVEDAGEEETDRSIDVEELPGRRN